MLAEELDYAIGVDTHRDQHVLAIADGRRDRAAIGSNEHARLCRRGALC